MSLPASYLLGVTFALLTQTRAHLILKEDRDGLALVEDEYQTLKQNIDAFLKGNL
jgi:hypothetical protein